MEVAGLAIGVAGLVDLFTTCVNCYKLVRRGAAVDKDYKVLETRFNNQEFRLLTWGKACGLVGGTEYETGLDEPVLRARVTATLECIAELFEDGRKLSKRFGLKVVEEGPTIPVNMGLITSTWTSSQAQPSKPWRGPFSRKWPESALGFRATAAWAISDRKKFIELVQNLKDFNDDLDAMTQSLTEISLRQRTYVEQEVAEITDLEMLEEMVLASQGDADVISDSVSFRLESVGSGTIKSGADSRNTGSYRTALAHIPTTIDEVIAEAEPEMRPLDKPLLPSYKLVCVGDHEAGVLRLLVSFARGGLPEVYMPAVFENYVAEFEVDGKKADLELWHTSGQETYDRLRPLTYPGTHVIMLCFRANDPTTDTKASIIRTWTPELSKYCPGVPIILVGLNTPNEDDDDNGLRRESATPLNKATKIDDDNDNFVPLSITKDIGAPKYFFCDPRTGFGITELFEYAIRAAIKFADDAGQKPEPPGGIVNKVKRLMGRVSRSIK